jgi:cytochrome c-type biogenesis protein
VGLLLATAFSATVALLFVWVVFSLAGDDGDDTVDVQEALDQLDAGPVVPEGTPVAEIGAEAPDVRFDYLPPDGGQETLDQLLARTGTPVVLNFWSSTCAPCLAEMPAFQEVAAANDDVVTVVGVDVQDTEEAGREMVARTGVTYRNARDPQGEAFATFGGTALPRTVVVGADGTVLDAHTGALDAAGLVDLLRRNGVEASV